MRANMVPFLILLFLCQRISATEDPKSITAKLGDNVILPCQAPNSNILAGVEWSRRDLEPEYVLLLRDGHIFLEDQQPSFKDRVDLQDKEMTNGNVSLILEKVRAADAGTYECRILTQGGERRKRAVKTIKVINLSVVDPPVKKNITAGETVVLPCQAPNTNSNPNTVVEWSRADLKPKYVLLYHDKQFDPEEQHPSFKNRVDLQDRQMKDGDVSLILKNVTTADSGTYECRVKIKTNRRTRANLNNDVISMISLSVVDPPGQTGRHTEDGGKEDAGKEDGGKEDGSVGLIVGLSVAAVLIVATVAGFLINIKKKSQRPYQLPAELQSI